MDAHAELRSAVRDVCAGYPDAYWREPRRAPRVPGGVRRGDDRGRLPRRADPDRVRRHGARPGRHERDPRGDQPLRRQRAARARADVHDGHAAAARLGRAEAALPAEDRQRRAAPAGVRRDRARGRHRHDSLARPPAGAATATSSTASKMWTSRVAALGPDGAAGPHDAARRGQAQDRRALDVPGRPAQPVGDGADDQPDPDDDQQRHHELFFEDLRDPRRATWSARRARASATSSTA